MVDVLTLDGFMRAPWLWLVAAAVAIVGVGRIVRLLTYDDFPPAVWLRDKWDILTGYKKWSKIAHCIWCATPYVMAGCFAWFICALLWVPWLMIAWWITFGWMALTYLASILTYWDEGKPDL